MSDPQRQKKNDKGPVRRKPDDAPLSQDWRPAPDHPMWEEQREAVRRIQARRAANGAVDDWDEIMNGPRDFRKGLPHVAS